MQAKTEKQLRPFTQNLRDKESEQKANPGNVKKNMIFRYNTEVIKFAWTTAIQIWKTSPTNSEAPTEDDSTLALELVVAKYPEYVLSRAKTNAIDRIKKHRLDIQSEQLAGPTTPQEEKDLFNALGVIIPTDADGNYIGNR